jgi:hypothetical protein
MGGKALREGERDDREEHERKTEPKEEGVEDGVDESDTARDDGTVAELCDRNENQPNEYHGKKGHVRGKELVMLAYRAIRTKRCNLQPINTKS